MSVLSLPISAPLSVLCRLGLFLSSFLVINPNPYPNQADSDTERGRWIKAITQASYGARKEEEENKIEDWC
jgi:hypothetical protein